MMGRSHLVLAGVAYAALSLRPIETPFGTLAAPLLLLRVACPASPVARTSQT